MSPAIITKQTTPEQLYERLKGVKVGAEVCRYSLKKCKEFTPLINEIIELKKKKNAVILAHTYVRPEIIYGVSDFVGDSYQLSKDSISTKADTIVFAAVRFMGETAKILNPHKTVLIPGQDDGCSLADSITAKEVRALRKKFPDRAFVCYINTSADVKAECDVCVTSGNIYKVIANMPAKKICFVPDRLMGENLKNELARRGIKKDIVCHRGACHVHEQFDPKLIVRIRRQYPRVQVVSHPECSPAIVAQSDFVGSTSQMLDYMRTTTAKEFLMLTECGLSARLQVEMPGKEFVGLCAICEYMKSNTLEEVLRVLKKPKKRDRVEVGETVRRKALKCLKAMFKYTEKK